MQNTQKKSQDIRRLAVMAMLAAMAYIAVVLIRIPVVSFLKYEPKDVLLVISGFLFGPTAGLIVTAVVALIECVTVSDTGIIGLLMNVVSSGLFVGIAAGIYRCRHRLSGAVLGLLFGTAAMTAGMLLWNFLITPLYMGVPRETVTAMLLPVFLPFNLLKGGLNTALTLLLYKSVSAALRKTHMLPPQESAASHRKINYSVVLSSLFALTTLILVLLAWSGRLG